MKRKFYLAALSVLSTVAIGSAYAANSTGNDALAIQAANQHDAM